MHISLFDYSLPKKLVAQYPASQRDKSRLMIINRETGDITHRSFSDIVDYLSKDDLLVINNTKVIPARLEGIKEATGAHIEILLVKDLGNNIWNVLARPAKRLKVGTIINCGENLSAEVVEKSEDGIVRLKFGFTGNFMEIISKIGQVPLPPYIKRSSIKSCDTRRYQTVYAKEAGSIAAPTAGLHFTKSLLKKIKKKGIQIAEVTLHVSLGTFKPVTETEIEKHRMQSEYYEITKETFLTVKKAIHEQKRIIAVGTTAMRVLESVDFNADNPKKNLSAWTDLFIYPGYKFKVVEAIITNFHLPRSTLLILVYAFAGRKLITKTYKEAIKKEYRFYSYGDAMFIT